MCVNKLNLLKIMDFKQTLVLLTVACFVSGQRPTFAGSKPIGFPELTNRTSDSLGNRFGDGTPLVLPIEAKGDRDLVERISKLPIDKQPFWYINWKALEENRKNPQTYEQRPNSFTDSINNQGRNVASNTDGLNSKFGTSVDSQSDNSASGNTQSRFNNNVYRRHDRY